MRKTGATYTEIKENLKVSKSSLSLWLRDMPLTKARMEEVRGKNPRRIERFRETMKAKKDARLNTVRQKAKRKIASLSDRELFLAGLFLYWGEGGKTQPVYVTLSNTDPAMLLFFIKWLESLGANLPQIRVRLHLYSDMNIKRELAYWSRTLALPASSFRKPYIKESKRADITYTQKFTHGTCNVIYGNRDIAEFVSESLKQLQSMFAE